ncbi:pirin family protein [Oceanicoccus sagamiensis]|uniref:Quercetin 2,3-dioxygenase n=1 Tax=Oceanicoccus sagamiensis TaxID=716816 RepID=A0A1X9N4V4_9GAMM|nr:pirin family protein [Oceanicoccus sagamiensis]ARN73158.1 quercetin 2,3-dioxygenase [Oceanicoccus sagamiensis]
MRTLQQVFSASPASDGDGVKIHRLAGTKLQAVLNPYLMIDEINSDSNSDFIGGFPEHPHRGFETISYIKAGRMRHRDHMGNEGVIGAGDVQWMTAGAGVLHSEMPEQEDGRLHGFQIWLNLPAAEKMKPAAYSDIRSHNIPSLALADSTVNSIAGDIKVNGQVLNGILPQRSTEPLFVDIELTANATIKLESNPKNPLLVYLYQGASHDLQQGQLGVYSSGESLRLEANNEGLKALLLSGTPIDEPIVQYGPFVMNTESEIRKAIDDYQNNRLVNL